MPPSDQYDYSRSSSSASSSSCSFATPSSSSLLADADGTNGHSNDDDEPSSSWHQEKSALLRRLTIGGEAGDDGEDDDDDDDDLLGERVFVPHPVDLWRLAFVLDDLGDELYVASRESEHVPFEKMRVAKTDVELVGCGSSGRLADLCRLGEPHAAAVLHALRQRFSAAVIHTYSGLFCVVVNPWRQLPIYGSSACRLYAESAVVAAESRAPPPPHVFAVAARAYDGVCNAHTNQSILITGESGAGKTENTRRIIEYLISASTQSTTTTASQHGDNIAAAVVRCGRLLEAFGNARTPRNHNSSRFGKFIRCEFDDWGRLTGAHIQCYLLEKSRVVSQCAGNANFHVFYQLLSEPAERLRELYLYEKTPSHYNYLSPRSGGDAPHVDWGEANTEMRHNQSLLRSLLCESGNEADEVWELVSACLAIGQVRLAERSGMDVSFVQCMDELERVADLLRVRASQLAQALTQPSIRVGDQCVARNQNLAKSQQSAAALSKLLYERLFNWIVARCNDALSRTSSSSCSGSMAGSSSQLHVLLTSAAGASLSAAAAAVPALAAASTNSFEQLCINYTNERLQQFFNERMFEREQREYELEGLDWTKQQYGIDLQPTIDLIEKPLGVMSLLEEECVVPAGSDAGLLQKLSQQLASHPSFSRFKQSTRQTTRADISIVHYAGRVDYVLDGWVDKDRNAVDTAVLDVLAESTHPLVTAILSEMWDERKSSSTCSNGGGGGGSRRPHATVSFVYRTQLSRLLATLDASQAHFVRCVVPNYDRDPTRFDAPLVLHQLRCNGVLEGIRLCRAGYPHRLLYATFIKRFGLLVGSHFSESGRVGAHVLCCALGLDRGRYQLGRTKLFARVGLLSELEARRRERVAQLITLLQAYIRSRACLVASSRRRQELHAATVLQTNVRCFADLSSWPWYRLVCRVRALIPAERQRVACEQLQWRVQQLEQDDRRRRDEMSTLQEMCARLRHDEHAATQQLIGTRTHLQDMLDRKERELQDAKLEIARSDELFHSMQRKFDEQHVKIMSMASRVQDYEKKIETLETETEEERKRASKVCDALEREKRSHEGLQSDYEELAQRLLESERKTDALRIELREQTEQVAVLANDRGEWRDRCNRQHDTINTLQNALAEANLSMSKADSAAAEEKASRRRMEREKGALEDENKQMGDHIKRLLTKYDDQKEEIRTKDTSIRRLEKKLSDKEAVMEACVKELKNGHKQTLADLQQQLEDLKRKTNRLEAENRGQKLRLESAAFERESSVDSDAGTYSDYGTGRSSSYSRLGSRQYSISSISSVSSIRTASRRRDSILHEQQQSSETSSSYALSRTPSTSQLVIEKERRIGDLERQITTLNTETAIQKREVEVYKSTLTAVETERDALAKQLRGLASDVEQLGRQVENEQQKADSLDLRLRKSQADCEHWKSKLEQAIEDSREEMLAERKKHADKLEVALNDRDARHAHFTALERQRDDLQTEVSRLETEAERVKSQCEQLLKTNRLQSTIGTSWEEQFRAATADLQAERDDNAALKAKVRRLYKQIDILQKQNDMDDDVVVLSVTLHNQLPTEEKDDC